MLYFISFDDCYCKRIQSGSFLSVLSIACSLQSEHGLFTIELEGN